MDLAYIEHTLKRHRINYERAIERLKDSSDDRLKSEYYRGCVAGLNKAIGYIEDFHSTQTSNRS